MAMLLHDFMFLAPTLLAAQCTLEDIVDSKGLDYIDITHFEIFQKPRSGCIAGYSHA